MLFNRNKVKQPLAIKFNHKEKLTSKAFGVSDMEAAKILKEVKLCLYTGKGDSISHIIEYVIKNIDFELEAKHLVFLVVILKDLSNPAHPVHKMAEKEFKELVRKYKKEKGIKN